MEWDDLSNRRQRKLSRKQERLKRLLANQRDGPPRPTRPSAPEDRKPTSPRSATTKEGDENAPRSAASKEGGGTATRGARPAIPPLQMPVPLLPLGFHTSFGLGARREEESGDSGARREDESKD